MTGSQTEQGSFAPGLSICIVTMNSLFYSRLALMQIRKLTRTASYEILVYDNGSTDGSAEWLSVQPDVRLFNAVQYGAFRHGEALNCLVSEATKEIVCTLCSDAFPVSREWILPALWLNDDVVLTGAGKGGRIIDRYVCPSFLFSWTEWLRQHSFLDDWPKYDTGERMAFETVGEGKQMRFVEMRNADLGRKFSAAPQNDYSGLVWHTWYTTRKKIGCVETDEGYHEYVESLLRKRFSLDF